MQVYCHSSSAIEYNTTFTGINIIIIIIIRAYVIFLTLAACHWCVVTVSRQINCSYSIQMFENQWEILSVETLWDVSWRQKDFEHRVKILVFACIRWLNLNIPSLIRWRSISIDNSSALKSILISIKIVSHVYSWAESFRRRRVPRPIHCLGLCQHEGHVAPFLLLRPWTVP